MYKKITILSLLIIIAIAAVYFLNNMGIISNSDSQHGYNGFYFLKNEIFSWKDLHNGGKYFPFPKINPTAP